MIAGTLVIEDHVLHFKLDTLSSRVEYTVQDSADGQTETLTVNGTDFLNALAVALDPNGLTDSDIEEMHERAERAMGEIRWIP